jgi:bacteriorhodopsin
MTVLAYVLANCNSERKWFWLVFGGVLLLAGLVMMGTSIYGSFRDAKRERE